MKISFHSRSLTVCRLADYLYRIKQIQKLWPQLHLWKCTISHLLVWKSVLCTEQDVLLEGKIAIKIPRYCDMFHFSPPKIFGWHSAAYQTSNKWIPGSIPYRTKHNEEEAYCGADATESISATFGELKNAESHICGENIVPKRSR